MVESNKPRHIFKEVDHWQFFILTIFKIKLKFKIPPYRQDIYYSCIIYKNNNKNNDISYIYIFCTSSDIKL